MKPEEQSIRRRAEMSASGKMPFWVETHEVRWLLEELDSRDSQIEMFREQLAKTEASRQKHLAELTKLTALLNKWIRLADSFPDLISLADAKRETLEALES